MENKNPFSLDSNQYMMLCSYLYHNGDEETFAELEKFDKYILMEYGLKSGFDFASKSLGLYKSGQPYFFCIGSSNWNRYKYKYSVEKFSELLKRNYELVKNVTKNDFRFLIKKFVFVI